MNINSIYKKVLALFTAIIISVSSYPISAFANEAITDSNFTLSDGAISSVISSETTSDGTIIYTITEGEMTDIVIIQTNGTITINGHEIFFSHNTTGSFGIMPFSQAYYRFSTTPFAGTTAGQYSANVTLSNMKSITFDETFTHITAGAISIAIGYRLGVRDAGTINDIFSGVSMIIRSYAVDNCPNSNVLYYKVRTSEHSSQSTSLNRLYKHVIYYYTSYYGTSCTSHTYYENEFYN